MNKTDDSLARARKDYPKKVKAGYQKWQDEEQVKLWRKEYARKWCKFTGPLKGYAAGKVKGLSALAVMALCADPQLKNFRKKGIDEIEGTLTPAWTATGKPGFKRVLANLIVRLGSDIIELGYEDQDIKRANQELNRLVNEYRRPEIAPFSPAGDSSRNNRFAEFILSPNEGLTTSRDSVATPHIDFIVVEVPDPDKPGQKKNWLGLDIQVSTV